MPTVDPEKLAQDKPFIDAMARFVKRVGVVACLNRADGRNGEFLFSQSADSTVKAAYGTGRTGGLTFAEFVNVIAPSICEVLTNGEGDIWYKRPEVPQSGAKESGYVLDARNPFLELGRGNDAADELTNGEAILKKVGKELKVLAHFQRRGNDLIDLFAATLHGLSSTEFKVGHATAAFVYGSSLPPRFVEPFVNYLFHREGGVKAFDEIAVWKKPTKEVQDAVPPATDDIWGKFYDDTKRQQLFASLIEAFKACLFGKEDVSNALQNKVKQAFEKALSGKTDDPAKRAPWSADLARFADVPKAFGEAFDAYHYVGQVLRSKVLLMSVATTVVRSYFAKEPDEEYFEEIFTALREGSKSKREDKFPDPVRRMPERHRRRLRQAMTQHIEFLLQEIRTRTDKNRDKAIPTVAEVYEAIKTRLKAKVDLDGKQFALLLDNLTDDLLGENRKLTKTELATLTNAKIKLMPDELDKIHLLRKAGLKLPDLQDDKEGLRSLLVLRATAHMAAGLEGHFKTFAKMFEAGDPAYRGLLRATQNLIHDVVSPIIFAAPGLSPEQLIALFKESVNATFVNAVMYDDASLIPVIALAENYKVKIAADLEDVEEQGRPISRLRRGVGAKTVTEFLPKLMATILKAAGEKLTTGLEALNLLLDDYVRRVRNAAAQRKAGMGTVFTLQKKTLQKQESVAASSAETNTSPGSAIKTQGSLASEVVTVGVDVVTNKQPAKAALQQRQENADKIAEAAEKALPKSGAPDWGKVTEAADKAADALDKAAQTKDKGAESTSTSDRYRAAKLAWYAKRAAECYKPFADEYMATPPVFEAAVAAVSKELIAQLEKEWTETSATLTKASTDADAAVDAELGKDPPDEKKLDAAFARQNAAQAEKDRYEAYFQPDPDLVHEAVSGLKEFDGIRPAAPTAGGFDAFVEDEFPAPAKPTAAAAKDRIKKVVETATEKANNLEDVFAEVSEKYVVHEKKANFARAVEQLELLKLMLLSERDLDLGTQMSEYYLLLLDLILAPNLDEFRAAFPLSKYFDLQSTADLKRLYNVLTGTSRDALGRIQSFVSELLGLEHLFAAAKGSGAEVVVWNMTAAEFLEGLNLSGKVAGDVASAWQPTGLTESGFQLPMMLYVTDSAVGYKDEDKANFLRQLGAKSLRYKQRAVVVPPVVMSFEGVKLEKGKPMFEIPATLLTLAADNLPFPYYLLGPSRPLRTQEFLTTVPLGYELLGYLLGDVKEYKLASGRVDIVPEDVEYLHILRQGGKALTTGFEDLLFSSGVDSLWVDLFLTCLNVIAIHRSQNSLNGKKANFTLTELQDWFDLWISKGRGASAAAGKRNQLEAAFWGRAVPMKNGSLKKLLRGLDVVPVGPDTAPGPKLPPAALEEVIVSGHAYQPRWFNRLWPTLGVDLEEATEEDDEE